MAIREIRLDGDPILRKICKPVTKVDDYVCRLLDDMLETMRKAEGVGLAAPQVGVLRRLVVIEVEDQVYGAAPRGGDGRSGGQGWKDAPLYRPWTAGTRILP